MPPSPARRPSDRKKSIAQSGQQPPRQLLKRNYTIRQLIVVTIVALIGSTLGFSAGIVAAEVYPADVAEIPPLEHWLQVPAKLTRQLSSVQQPTIILPSDSLFADSKSRLRAEGVLILNEVAEELAPYSTAQVMIAVHTDNVGEAIDDQQLSLMRARTIQLYLQQKLKSDRRWLIVGYGSTNPIADNRTNAGRQRNRRVELTIF